MSPSGERSSEPFWCSCWSPCPATLNGDVTQPNVTASSPADGATDASVDTNIRVTFSEAVDESATEAAVATTADLGCIVGWSADPSELTCNPSSARQEPTRYEVLVGASAADQPDPTPAIRSGYSAGIQAGFP